MLSINKRLLCVVLALVMILGMLPMAVFAADTVRLYCAAPSAWVNCNVYYWGNSAGAPTWPGLAMTKGADGIWYYDVPADATNVIFNNGSAQSADLVMPSDDKVQWNYSAKEWVTYGTEAEEVEAVYYLRGTMNGWGTSDPMTKNADGTYSITMELTAGAYEFKGAIEDWSWSVPSGPNMMMTLTEDDTVTFTLDVNANTLTYVLASGTVAEVEYYLRGTMNDWIADDSNKMEKLADGQYSITMNLEAGTYEYKVGNVDWTVAYPGGMDNLSVTVSAAGAVTFLLDLNTGMMHVNGEFVTTPDPVDYDYFVAGSAGLCGVEWDPAANQMTEVESGIYTITFTDVAAGSYAFKVTTGSWDTPSYGVDGGDYAIQVEATSDVVITFNKETEEITCQINPADELEPLPVPVEKYVEFTVDSLGLTSNKYTSSTATVDGVGVEWIQLGNYGDGIQMRDKNGNTSMFWSTTALGYGITKIEFTYSDTKSVYDNNNMIVNFGNDVSGADCSVILSTVAGEAVYVITPDANSYGFFYIEWDTGYTSYWKSIKVYYMDVAGENPNPNPDPEPEPELPIVSVSEALAGDAGTGFKVQGVVTLVDGKNLYVQDETGAICVRMSVDVEGVNVGDTVIATGVRADYNGLPQLGSGEFEMSSGGTLSAKDTTIDALTAGDICTYVKLTGLTVTEIFRGEDGSYTNPNVTFTDGENTIQLYKGVVADDLAVGDKVDIYCAVSCYNETLQLRNTTASEITISSSECGHNYTSKVTNPTCTEGGYTTYTCSACGDSYVADEVEALGHSFKNGLCVCGEISFPDVSSKAWYYNSVKFAVGKGYFSGYKSGNFGPTDQITRQDFVVVLARIAKVDLSQYTGRTGFPDVKAGDYYEKAVKWASSNGIVNGYNNGNFGVGDKITREQMVTILYNYAKKMGYDVSVPADAAAKLNAYADAHKITGYARPAVIWALYKGVISGMNATTIGPQEYASRGQTATILMNISKKGIMPI